MCVVHCCPFSRCLFPVPVQQTFKLAGVIIVSMRHATGVLRSPLHSLSICKSKRAINILYANTSFFFKVLKLVSNVSSAFHDMWGIWNGRRLPSFSMFMQKVGFINKARKMHEHVQFIGLHYLRAKKQASTWKCSPTCQACRLTQLFSKSPPFL